MSTTDQEDSAIGLVTSYASRRFVPEAEAAARRHGLDIHHDGYDILATALVRLQEEARANPELIERLQQSVRETHKFMKRAINAAAKRLYRDRRRVHGRLLQSMDDEMPLEEIASDDSQTPMLDALVREDAALILQRLLVECGRHELWVIELMANHASIKKYAKQNTEKSYWAYAKQFERALPTLRKRVMRITREVVGTDAGQRYRDEVRALFVQLLRQRFSR